MCSNYVECFSALVEKLIENMKSETFFVRIVKVMVKKQKTKEKEPGCIMLLSSNLDFNVMSEKEMIKEHPLYLGDDETPSGYERILAGADWPIYQQKEDEGADRRNCMMLEEDNNDQRIDNLQRDLRICVLKGLTPEQILKLYYEEIAKKFCMMQSRQQKEGEGAVRRETRDLLKQCNYPGIYIIFGYYKDRPRIPLYLGTCKSMRDRGFLEKHDFPKKFVESEFWLGKCGLNEEYLTLSITMIEMDKSVALSMEDVFLRVFDFSFNKRNNDPMKEGPRYDKKEFIRSMKENAIEQASEDEMISKEKEFQELVKKMIKSLEAFITPKLRRSISCPCLNQVY